MAPPVDDYDVWLFDLDGTLVDTEWSYTRSVFDQVGDRLGVEFTDQHAERLWHGIGGTRDHYLRAWGIDPEAFWPAFHAVEDPMARAEATYLYDDARPLGGLDAPTGVVTHCQSFLTDPVLDHLDIADWFDVVVSCTDDTGWKPDPQPLRVALGGLDAQPDAAGVYAGDAVSDVGAAKNAGLDAVHVERHSPGKRGHCVLGDHRVSSFADVFPSGDGDA
ncbi:HAD family hydrolase [Halobacterium salinarum]|uniref:HAD family hydrolase n=1 Tax=Halobacterium TaxID=2239 RepID=UPI00196518DC|nr:MULTISPECIES: HAD family hydrolase [Halobacterium]MCF2164775.1 HAD family hydrolase [Halobacterium salinarum]MCF2168194.1 HAD family hydrolase [Halobacterium salinarum]MCF2238762.1 HAD family hydrolase [Halobacterium salinarum]MDL0130906.1 HAD family hydrolase [Halobacterium salinarum]MDL0139790.1 HAD family hydrolase [Halobacterium salinarum]